MPYRIDLPNPPSGALDTLVALGALDIDSVSDGLAALLPDAVSAAEVANALGVPEVRVSPAVARDDHSIWTLSRPAIRLRSLVILPADRPPQPGAVRLTEGDAFGTGLHATTALCLEALEDLIDAVVPDRLLDVGTGSGVLALAALQRGVARATGCDRDAGALKVAVENARLNGVADRLSFVRGGPESIRGAWPLVVANIRAAELMAMAQPLAWRVASKGRLVLSGIPECVGSEVEHVYQRLGMKTVTRTVREGWIALGLYPSW